MYNLQIEFLTHNRKQICVISSFKDDDLLSRRFIIKSKSSKVLDIIDEDFFFGNITLSTSTLKELKTDLYIHVKINSIISNPSK